MLLNRDMKQFSSHLDAQEKHTALDLNKQRGENCVVSVKNVMHVVKEKPGFKKDYNRKEMIFKCFTDFIQMIFTTSSVHGFNHIAANRHPIERGLWVLAVGCGFIGAVWLSLSTWDRYQSSPTVISLEKNYLDWNTTFPALTICPFKKYDELEANLLAQDMFAGLDNETAVYRLGRLINASYDSFEDVEELRGLDPKAYLQTYLSLLYNFSYALSNSNSEPAIFISTIREMGICYTYNSLAAPYANPSYWNEKRWDILPELKLLQGGPLDGDLFAQVMDMNSPGKVYIHGPGELPEIASKAYTTEEKHYLTLDLSAMTTYSTDATRSLSVSQRKCRFMEESNLKTSPVYSYNLCRAECRMRLAHLLCGCIPYFYRPNGNYKICDVRGMLCLSKNKERLIKLRNSEGVREECKCYPSCNDVNYVLQGDSSVDWFLGTNLRYGLIKHPRTQLKRDVVFGVYDLLGQLGGTFGLCLGCSILSMAEFVYFFTLRLFLFIWSKYSN